MFVEQTLGDWGLGDLVDDVALCASELVANVVVHAGTPIDLRLQREVGGVRVEVRDASTFRVVPPVAPAGQGPGEVRDPLIRRMPARGGLGLLVVSRLAAAWGVDPLPDGKVVWALFRQARPSGPVPGELRVPVLQPASILAPDDWPEVEVRDVPVRLLLALEEHVRSLVREAALIVDEVRDLSELPLPSRPALDEEECDQAGPELPVELVVATMDRYWSAMRSAWEEARPSGTPGPGRATFVTKLPPSTATDGPRFLEALDAADSLARRRRLLTLPADEELVSFRRWFVGSLARQVEGAPAESCPFPA